MNGEDGSDKDALDRKKERILAELEAKRTAIARQRDVVRERRRIGRIIGIIVGVILALLISIYGIRSLLSEMGTPKDTRPVHGGP